MDEVTPRDALLFAQSAYSHGGGLVNLYRQRVVTESCSIFWDRRK